MKRKIFSIIVFILLISNASFAHKEWVHQYIVQQAYRLLEQYYVASGGNINDLAEIKSQIFRSDGTPFTGGTPDDINFPYETSYGIVTK